MSIGASVASAFDGGILRGIRESIFELVGINHHFIGQFMICCSLEAVGREDLSTHTKEEGNELLKMRLWCTTAEAHVVCFFWESNLLDIP